MNTRWIGVFAAAVGLTTVAWVVLLGVSESGSPQVDTLEEKIALVKSLGHLYAATYLNAALLTLLAVAFMSGVYAVAREKSPLWSAVAFAFVPVYGLANLAAYLSQVFLVPPLLKLHGDPASRETAGILLGLTIHTWPGSAIEALNGMAYAALGIPSIVFPLVAMRTPRLLRVGGLVLALSGVLSLVAFAGLLASVGYLTSMSVAGGVVFLVSLGPIAVHYIRKGHAPASS